MHVPNTDASKQVIANTTNNTKRADDYSPIGSPTNIGHAPETLESRRLTDKRQKEFNLNILDLSQRTQYGSNIKAQGSKMKMSRLEHLYSHKNMSKLHKKLIKFENSNEALNQNASMTQTKKFNEMTSEKKNLDRSSNSPQYVSFENTITNEDDARKTFNLNLGDMTKTLDISPKTQKLKT